MTKTKISSLICIYLHPKLFACHLSPLSINHNFEILSIRCTLNEYTYKVNPYLFVQTELKKKSYCYSRKR